MHTDIRVGGGCETVLAGNKKVWQVTCVLAKKLNVTGGDRCPN